MKNKGGNEGKAKKFWVKETKTNKGRGENRKKKEKRKNQRGKGEEQKTERGRLFFKPEGEREQK